MNIFKNIIKNRFISPKFPIKLITNSFRFAETARQLQLQMKQQRARNLNNKFKALSTSFGLKMPNEITKNYPKPSTYEFSIESLRRNSHMYPQYLLTQLNKKNSQYHQVIQNLFTTLGNATNKQSIQFIQFIIKWKLCKNTNQYGQMIIRKIYQMKIDLSQIFHILKITSVVQEQSMKQLIMTHLQNKLLEIIVNIDPYQYESLFKILNFMRLNDINPKVTQEQSQKIIKDDQNASKQLSFFKIVESILLKNIDEIPLPNFVQMIVHYANNIKQNQDDRIQIMRKVEPKVIQNIQFFNHEQLIAIMFSYIKTQTQSDQLIQTFVKRIDLLYFQISWENKKKILNIASSLPYNKWQYVVGISIFQILKGKKVIHKAGVVETNPQASQVQFQLLPTIYASAYQTNLLTAELVQKLQSKILQNIFNYNAEDVGLIAWLFTITPATLNPKRQHKDILYTKLQSIIVGGFIKSTFSLKNIAMIVWSMCNSGGKSNAIYKQNAPFWKNIQYYIEQQISSKKQQNILNGCCQILWAYLNHKPMSFRTLNAITNVIIEKQNANLLQQQMFNFELTTITSFYYSIRKQLPVSLFQYIQKLCLKYFTKYVQELNYLQIIKMLKYIILNQKQEISTDKLDDLTWKSIINQFQLDLKRIEYDYIMAVINFILICPESKKGSIRNIELVKKLMIRKKQLQQLKSYQK